MGSFIVGLTATVRQQASRIGRPREVWIRKGPEKMMAFLKARWKLKESVKAPTKAGPTDAEYLPTGSEKVQTMS